MNNLHDKLAAQNDLLCAKQIWFTGRSEPIKSESWVNHTAAVTESIKVNNDFLSPVSIIEFCNINALKIWALLNFWNSSKCSILFKSLKMLCTFLDEIRFCKYWESYLLPYYLLKKKHYKQIFIETLIKNFIETLISIFTFILKMFKRKLVYFTFKQTSAVFIFQNGNGFHTRTGAVKH